MAARDRASGRLVVRIAYDGAPLAGKTASLRALGAAMSVPVTSFDEAYGRTLWFDWMAYRGGMFQGQPIECEVAAVPGQAALGHRRRALLADADAVVFVADASPAGQRPTVAALRRLVAELASDDPPRGLVVQLNKADVAGSWTTEHLRAAAGIEATTSVVPTVATDGIGVRHAFVFAVRAAVRRASGIDASTGLPAGDLQSPEQVLRDLRAAGAATVVSP